MVYIRMMSVSEMKNIIDLILMHFQDLHVSYASSKSYTISVNAIIYYIVAAYSGLFSIMVIDVRRFKLCVFS